MDRYDPDAFYHVYDSVLNTDLYYRALGEVLEHFALLHNPKEITLRYFPDDDKMVLVVYKGDDNFTTIVDILSF